MTSFTYEGNIELASQWLPFAVTEQKSMLRLGLITKDINPSTGVYIHIQSNHIHIKAGVSGYEFSIHAYGGPNDFSHMDVFYFYDSEPARHEEGSLDSLVKNNEAGSPYQGSYGLDHMLVQHNHINMWLGNGATVTGCVGQRYGAGVGFSTAEMSDRVTERFPRYVKDRVLLWEGDADVTAAAQSLGVFIGVTITGTVYIWNNDGRSSQAPLSGVECYWVFNKAGTECSGINYSPYQTGVDRVATLHTLKFSGDSSSIDIDHSSYEVHRSTYAVDYDNTNAENNLITCQFETSQRNTYIHTPWYFDVDGRDPDDYSRPDDLGIDEGYINAMDSVMIISNGEKQADRVPFFYNYSRVPSPNDVLDPTDVTYRGQLLALDLRFRSYCIASDGWISNKQHVLSPHTPTGNTDIVGVVDGHVIISGALSNGVIVDFQGIQTLENTSYPVHSIVSGYNDAVTHAQVMAVSPGLEDAGFFMRSNYTGLSHNIDFLVSDGAMFGGYHEDIHTTLQSELSGYDDLLISSYSSWV